MPLKTISLTKLFSFIFSNDSFLSRMGKNYDKWCIRQSSLPSSSHWELQTKGEQRMVQILVNIWSLLTTLIVCDTCTEREYKKWSPKMLSWCFFQIFPTCNERIKREQLGEYQCWLTEVLLEWLTSWKENRPFAVAITWYKNNHVGEQTAHWEIQNKRIFS